MTPKISPPNLDRNRSSNTGDAITDGDDHRKPRCLDHGERGDPAMLNSVFDAAEDSVFDALSQAIYLPSEW
jgi:hypothetical protein